MLNIERVINGFDSEIDVSGKYSFDDSYYKGTDIKKLSDIDVNGKIYKGLEEKVMINIDISGKMLLTDSISMEQVEYEFSVNVDDNLEEFITNVENSIDIMEILWQNIVLEVPLRYTLVEDTSKLQGDGWKLVSEEDRIIKNNPFSVLLENEEKE